MTDILATLGARFDAEFPESEAVNLDRGMTMREMAKLGPEPWPDLPPIGRIEPDMVAELDRAIEANAAITDETLAKAALIADWLAGGYDAPEPEPSPEPCDCGSRECDQCWQDDPFCDDERDCLDGLVFGAEDE